MARSKPCSVPAAMSCLREWRPKAAAALDAVDEALDALDEAADAAEADADIETVVISFGSPTRQATSRWLLGQSQANHRPWRTNPYSLYDGDSDISDDSCWRDLMDFGRGTWLVRKGNLGWLPF